MRVVIAPDSFKGSLGAADAAAAIAAGWRDERPDDDLVLLPQADGGEGTLDAIASAVPGAVRHEAGPVTGPDGRPTPGSWLELPDGTAVVELAHASGLPLMARLDPLGATTRGLGETIAAALEHGPSSLVIGLGGSASTDGGAGALAALGMRLLDAAGAPLPDGGGALERLSAVDRSGLRPAPAGGVRLLSDVAAPLLGERGAAAVFGPQKGATPDDVARLERALARFADLLGGDRDAIGAGAAGGAGYGFMAAWDGTIELGSIAIAELTGLTAAIPTADVVLSGEGRFDATSSTGKVVGSTLALVERLPADRRPRAGVIAGQLAVDPVSSDGIPLWGAALDRLAGSAEAAIADPQPALRAAGAAAARALA